MSDTYKRQNWLVRVTPMPNWVLAIFIVNGLIALADVAGRVL